MDAQLLISDIQQIRVTWVHEPVAARRGEQRFVRIITVRYADDSEYEICLTANDARSLALSEQDPLAA